MKFPEDENTKKSLRGRQRPPPMLFRNLSSQLKTGAPAPDRSAVKNRVKPIVVILETLDLYLC